MQQTLPGNSSASVNQTASEFGQNVSSAVGNAGPAANQTMSELGSTRQPRRTIYVRRRTQQQMNCKNAMIWVQQY